MFLRLRFSDGISFVALPLRRTDSSNMPLKRLYGDCKLMDRRDLIIEHLIRVGAVCSTAIIPRRLPYLIVPQKRSFQRYDELLL